MELHLANFSEEIMRHRGCLCPTAKLHLGRTMQLWMSWSLLLHLFAFVHYIIQLGLCLENKIL